MSSFVLEHSASLRKLAACLFEENPVQQPIDKTSQGKVAMSAQTSVPSTTDEPVQSIRFPAE